MNLLDSRTHQTRLVVVAAAFYVAGAITVLVQLRSFEIFSLIAYGSWILIGGILVRRRTNALGLLLAAYGSIWIVAIAGVVTAETLDGAGRVVGAGWVSLGVMVLANFSFWLTAVMWLIFPDGRPRTPADRRLIRGSGVLALAGVVMGALARPQVTPELESYPHPFVDDELARTMYEFSQIPVLAMFMFVIFVVVRLVVRMRNGSPVERRQVGWIAMAVILGLSINITAGLVKPLGTEDRSWLMIDAVATVLLPLAIGVAIMRYRLYEIDRIISRSVTYGALAVFIGGVYVAIVVGLGALVGGDAGFWLSIAATALVAIAFQPARQRVERWANRLVYGDRATPHEVLVQFSHRSSELSDEELMERVPQLIADGTGARTAALWVRSGDGFRTTSTWPTDAAPRYLDGLDEFTDPEADLSLPVFHDGELFGGLSLTKEEGEPVTAPEAALLADLAAGLGLALRNTRLTVQLRRQVAELEASRERVLAAADAARRELENTLDSGPQQQLVALKVKLGPTRKRAEQLGATKTAELLTTLEHQAGDAIAAIRAFAGGIYPPLLEAEGLAVAIGQQARGAALAVSVHGDGIARYPREVEAAVYFTVLEALQNTTKYADATSAAVNLTATNGTLEFEVTDDGRGFDSASVARGSGLNGIADRLDTVGGHVTITSEPGCGTTVAGTVPIARGAGA